METESNQQKYSEVDETKYYTSTINSVQSNLSILKQSDIPFTINITPEFYYNEQVPCSDSPVIRCSICKSYISPFIKIISPGFKWICNICMTTNEEKEPFYMINRQVPQPSEFSMIKNAIHNHNSYSRAELVSTVYELQAPTDYSLRTPSPIKFCFLIEITYESLKQGMFQIIAKSIIDSLDGSTYDKRAQMMFIFFSSQIYILRHDMEIVVVSNTSFMPYFQIEDYLFNLDTKIDFEFLENLFLDMKCPKNNYGDALKISHAILNKTGGIVLSFLSTQPNYGIGLINSNNKLKSENFFYKELASLFAKNLISVTHFFFPKTQIELPTLSVLSKATGGMLFYYPNFDGDDMVFVTKVRQELINFFNLPLNHECVCRIRTSKDVFIKEYNGSMTQRTIDLLSFAAFYPPHTFNIDLEIVDNIKNDGVCLQIALMRTTKSGAKMIRVINICIPLSTKSFYEVINPNAIIKTLAQKAFYYEVQKKEAGSQFITKSLISILKAYKKSTNLFDITNLPEGLSILPILSLFLCKSLPLRPVSYTPLDYRVYYMYLISNSYPTFVDTIIYPTLLPLHQNDIQPQNLSLDYLETNGLYLLDTGVSIYFFVGAECPISLSDKLFDLNQETGRFIFYPPYNEFSKLVIDIICELTKERFISPYYILIRDDGQKNLYKDVFFTYFYEDSIHNMPKYSTYIKMIEDLFK